MLDSMSVAFSWSTGALVTSNYRRRTAVCCVDAISPCAVTPDANRRSVNAVFPTVITDRPSTAEIAEGLVAQGMMNQDDVKLFEMLSDSRAALFAKVLVNRTRHITFVLDGVFGAHNLAAIVRSCDAWGLQDLHLIAQSEEYLPKRTKESPEAVVRQESILEKLKHDPSVRKVSKNSDKWVTIREYSGVRPCLDSLRQAGYRIIVSSLRSDAKSIHELDLSGKCAFVFGNERHGVTGEMEAEGDEFFTIQQQGFVESMNVSVAAGNTACLTTTGCRGRVGDHDYFLSAEEQRELAHDWLMERFSSKKTLKPLHTPRDVTKLGIRAEQKIVEEGMFATVTDISLSGEPFWSLALRLSGDGGARVATDFLRRKIGVLGENRQEKRCRAINFFLGGSHALSCEAALANSGPSLATRKTLQKLFELACDLVQEQYSPYFDEFGIPTLPAHFEESRTIFHRLARSAPDAGRLSCLQFASQILGMKADDVKYIIRNASAHDVARCIADTIRCGEQQASELDDVAGNQVVHFHEIVAIVKERYPSREVMKPRGQVNTTVLLNQRQRDCLQVFLRLSNTAYLCSELYQTVWDRHLKRNNVTRIHSIGFNILESLLSDAFQEMQVLKVSHGVALSRVIFEWEQVLERLKRSFDDE